MVQNTMRALPGSLSGGRSTIAEYSARSRGIMGLAMQDFLLIAGTFSRRCSYAQPDAMYRKTLGVCGNTRCIQTVHADVVRPLSAVHSRASGNPEPQYPILSSWVPAFTGTNGNHTKLRRCGD